MIHVSLYELYSFYFIFKHLQDIVSCFIYFFLNLSLCCRSTIGEGYCVQFRLTFCLYPFFPSKTTQKLTHQSTYNFAGKYFMGVHTD